MAEVYVAEQDLFRVTLTAILINRAAVVAFLVAGGDKAAVLRDMSSKVPGIPRVCPRNSSARRTATCVLAGGPGRGGPGEARRKGTDEGGVR